MIKVFGEARSACLAKELTKIHEYILCDRLSNINKWLSTSVMQAKGEFVILVEARKLMPDYELTIHVEDLIKVLSAHLSPAKVAMIAATLSGLPRKQLYRKKSRA